MAEPIRIILIGPPGAGKGTQATRLRDRYSLPHISAGDLFRARVKDPNDPMGQQIKAILDAGQLVPDQITIQMIAERLRQADCAKGFILDGFPRSIAQAEALDEMLQKEGIKLTSVIQMEVDDEKLVERISGRFTCGQCNEGYHDSFKPPHDPHTCDVCGAVDKFTRRSDDNAEAVRARLKTYYSQTTPILPFYEGKGMLKRVDGMASMDEVTKRIEAILAAASAPAGGPASPKP